MILTPIHGLADYENEPDAVVATENLLAQQLFGPQPGAEVVIAELDDSPVGFALSSTTSRRGRAGAGCIWRTCSSSRRLVDEESGER